MEREAGHKLPFAVGSELRMFNFFGCSLSTLPSCLILSSSSLSPEPLSALLAPFILDLS